MKLLLVATIGLALAGCIPPAGFARTPTPAPPTITAAEICADYVKDLARAQTDIRRDLEAQITDLIAASATGRRPAEALARRITDRRDDLLRAAIHFERAAPCPEGEAGRARIARAAGLIRQATDVVNRASDENSPRLYGQAGTLYRQALEALNAG